MGLISLIAGGIHDANRAIKQNQAQGNDEVQNVVVNNQYSINVPTFLTPTNKLGEDASLQYWNKTLDISFQVIDEPKQVFLDSLKELREEVPDFGKREPLLHNMAMLTLGNLFDDMDKVEIGNYQETTINGLNALTLNAFQKSTFLKDALYGSFAFVEGRDTLYQIIILSGGTSIKKLADKLEHSIKSFKEM